MLQQNILVHGCYIKGITNNVGNCLFESLASLGLGDNDLGISPHVMIRKSVASVLLSVKTEVGFFPKIPDMTPEELFASSNDVEYVKDKNTGEIYCYDYEMMIWDLNTSFSWEKLPTEFILTAISRIYNVEIQIYHNKTDFINKINALDNTDSEDVIRLGQINEEHYFPLLLLPDELKSDFETINELLNTDIKYAQSIEKFKKWSKSMMDSIGFNQASQANQANQANYANHTHSSNDDIITMKTNKILSQEQKQDYDEISNFDNFDIII